MLRASRPVFPFVDDLLNLSRMSRGTFELRQEQADLKSIVFNAAEMYAPWSRVRGTN
jgi:hypothetical protein